MNSETQKTCVKVITEMLRALVGRIHLHLPSSHN